MLLSLAESFAERTHIEIVRPSTIDVKINIFVSPCVFVCYGCIISPQFLIKKQLNL